jgi:transposase InsO family protein
VSAKFAFIDAEKALYSIVKMCAWIGVSTSGYYEWRDRPPSATVQRRGHLATLIEWIFTDSDQTYGHRRIRAALARQGERVTPELVRSIMRERGLNPCQPRPFRPTTTLAGDAGSIPDLVARDFTADAPGTKLVGDITYLPTWQGWLYLATVIDCHTKACIGYALAEHLRADLVIDALQMAARNYTLADGAIFHSDRGTQPGLNRSSQHRLVPVTLAARRVLRLGLPSECLAWPAVEGRGDGIDLLGGPP